MKKWYVGPVCALALMAGTVAFTDVTTVQAAKTVTTEQTVKSEQTKQTGKSGQTKKSEKSEKTKKSEQTKKSEKTNKNEKKEVTHSISKEKMNKMVKFVKKKLKENGLDTRKEIEAAIKEGEKEFDITLSDKSRKRAADIAEKVMGLGLDTNALLDKGVELYDEYGDQLKDNLETVVQEEIIKPAKEAVKKKVNKAVKGFVKDVKTSVKGFFNNVIS